MNVKVNDNVLVITGKYAGRQGKVLSTDQKNNKIVVQDINIHRKAQKARKSTDVSKIVEIEAPIDASNVMVVCSSCNLPTRVKKSVVEGKRVRVCAKCGAVLDKAYAGKAAKAEKAAKKEEPKRRQRKREKKAAKEAAANEAEEKEAAEDVAEDVAEETAEESEKAEE